MTGEALATRAPSQTALSNEQLRYIASTDFVPKGLRGNLPAILACVATGRALGIPDMAALRSIHIIDGKATYSAELMVMLARKAGHSIEADYGEGSVTARGRRGDNGDASSVTWTLAMAERANLLSKDNWKKYPESMLWARAVSQLCRVLFADVFAGSTYTPDEAELSDWEREVEAVDDVLDALPVPVDEAAPDDHLDGDVVEVAPGEQASLESFEARAEAARARRAALEGVEQ